VKKSDLLLILGVIIILLASVFVMVYYFQRQSNECLTNPLVYGAKQFTERTGKEFIGTGYFLIPNSPIIVFNSTNIRIKK